MSELKALKKIIAAWESLPDGHHYPRDIEKWLRDKMKPAIDAGRKAADSAAIPSPERKSER